MKIYIASSWKNEILCRVLAKVLREHEHEVDCFCEPYKGRFVFSWKEFGKDPEEVLKTYDAIKFLAEPKTQRAFAEDKKWIDWADAVVLVLPSGKSSHLEAGYAKGQGKKLYLWGDFPAGEFDVMYGFADGLYRDLIELLEKLNKEK